MSQTLNISIAVAGIDIGKNSFHLVGQDQHGAGEHTSREKTDIYPVASEAAGSVCS